MLPFALVLAAWLTTLGVGALTWIRWRTRVPSFVLVVVWCVVLVFVQWG